MASLQVNGIRLNYETCGQGEPILFIHGLGSAGRDWQYQVEFFSQDYQVVVCDVRGHGKSEKPPGPYSIPLFARDTAGLIESLGIAPAHVVGVSMGGMIGFQLAIDASELVKSLVVVNSAPEMVPKTLKERLKVYQRLWIVRRIGMRRMGEVLSKQLFPKEEQAGLRQVLVEHWAENDRRAYLDSLRAIVGWSVNDRLHEIQCKVLVITGDQDFIPIEAKADYVKRLPGAELLVIADSLHGTPVDQPQKFNQALLQFLQSQRLTVT